MSGAAVNELAIDYWIKGLEALPDEDFPAQCTAFLRANRIERGSLEPYAHFDAHHYTRNLIFKNHMFEALTICWEAGQNSAIHNHRDQQCWMVMGEGTLENINYRVLERDPRRGTCRIEAGRTEIISRASPLAVDDDEPVHRVVNCPSHAARAISVHIYSRPFDICEVYSLERGTYKDIQLSYWSEYGRRSV